jgi:outer membrane biosynthesis protein TonB
MHTIKIELNETQYKAALQHSEKAGLDIGPDIVNVWWGRTRALATYAERLEKGSKMRAYAPLGLSDIERARLKALAVKEGVALKPKDPPAPKPKEEPKKAAPKAAEPKKAEPKATPPKKKIKAIASVKPVNASVETAPVKPKLVPAPILDTDSPEVAIGKAELIADADGKLSDSAVLKAAGRDIRGKHIETERTEPTKAEG